MSFFDFFHTFFGDRNEDHRFPNNTDKNGYLNNGREDNSGRDVEDFFFVSKMMTDTFWLHEFVMKRMNDVFKASTVELTDLLSDFGDVHSSPAIEESLNPRDHYLKPEFNRNSDNKNNVKEGGNQKVGDSMGWTSSYRKTITLSDGTVKTEEIIRNADGTVKKTESTTLLDDNNPLQLPPFPSLHFRDLPGVLGQSDNLLTTKDPKYDFLKPGYENSNANPGKMDTDLDKEISLSGIINLPDISKIPSLSEVGKRFSCTIETLATRDGVTEAKEIVKIPDGTEEKEDTKLHDLKKSGFFGLNAREIQNIVDSLFK